MWCIQHSNHSDHHCILNAHNLLELLNRDWNFNIKHSLSDCNLTIWSLNTAYLSNISKVIIQKGSTLFLSMRVRFMFLRQNHLVEKWLCSQPVLFVDQEPSKQVKYKFNWCGKIPPLINCNDQPKFNLIQYRSSDVISTLTPDHYGRCPEGIGHHNVTMYYCLSFVLSCHIFVVSDWSKEGMLHRRGGR